jgi:sortase A
VSASRVLLRTGALLLTSGLILLAFVAYQLWGTALYEQNAQRTLRSELAKTVGRQRPVPVGSSSTSGSRSTTSTAPRRQSTSTTTTSTTTPRRRPSTTTTAAPRHHATSTTTSPRPPTSTTTTIVMPSVPIPAPSASDPPIGTPIGYLSIPKIALNEAIVEGVGEAQLQQGPGHYPGTPLPGEAGNVGIAGHRTTYAAPFYNLNELVGGDPIYVQTAQGSFTYDVTQSFAVVPTDVAVLDATSQPTLTLTTCNPRYSAAQRLIVKANLVASQLPPAESTTTTTTTHPSPVTPRPRELAGEQSLAGNGSSGSLTLVVVWGLVTAALAAAVVLVHRRRNLPRLLRLGTLGLGGPLALGSLFLFFVHVSTALPGSF